MTISSFKLIFFSVFGPTLLRTSESPATLSSVVDTKEQVRVVELMTKYAHEIFGSEASQVPDRPSNKLRHRREMSPRQDEVHEDAGDDDKAGINPTFFGHASVNSALSFFLILVQLILIMV